MHIFDNFVNNIYFVDFMRQLIIIIIIIIIIMIIIATTIIIIVIIIIIIIIIIIMITMMIITITIIKSVSMRKPGRTRQEVIQLKSPILLKLGRNVRFGE